MSDKNQKRPLDWTDWLTVALLWVAIPLGVLYVVLGTPGFVRILRNSIVASWAQALFSALAVLAAVGLAWWQHRRDELRRWADAQNQINNVVAGLFYARYVIEAALSNRDRTDNTVRDAVLAAGVQLSRLTSVPLHQIPAAYVMHAISHAATCQSNTQTELTQDIVHMHSASVSTAARQLVDALLVNEKNVTDAALKDGYTIQKSNGTLLNGKLIETATKPYSPNSSS